MQKVYKIKNALKAPMILAVILSIPVFVDVFRRGYETKILVMASLLVVLFYLFTLNNLIKRLIVSDTEIVQKSLFGSNRALLNEIKIIDGISFGSRQFVAVTAKKYLLIANNFDNFADIIDTIREVAREETVAPGLIQMREKIVNRKSDVSMAWIVALLLIICNVILFFPGISF